MPHENSILFYQNVDVRVGWAFEVLPDYQRRDETKSGFGIAWRNVENGQRAIIPEWQTG